MDAASILVLVSIAMFLFSVLYAVATAALLLFSLVEATLIKIERGELFTPPARLRRPGISLIAPAYNMEIDRGERAVAAGLRVRAARGRDRRRRLRGRHDQRAEEQFRPGRVAGGRSAADRDRTDRSALRQPHRPTATRRAEANGGRSDAINAG